MSYKFVDTGSHGYLVVTKEEIKRLGVQISSWSHVSGPDVFLEEDSDAPAFTRAKQDAGETFEHHVVYEEHSRIRDLPSYK